jgi:hypothetical protein
MDLSNCKNQLLSLAMFFFELRELAGAGKQSLGRVSDASG